MSSGTFETTRAFPQQQFADRFETRNLRGGASDTAFTVSEVDNGKFLNVSLAAGNVTVALPPARSLVGVQFSGVVVSASTLTADLVFTGVDGASELLASRCLFDGTNSVTSTSSGAALTIPNVRAGSTFTAGCTGSRWVVQAVASSAGA